MLKGIDPLLTPELLKILAEMGHGDEIVLVDANFPAASVARNLVRLEGHSVLAVTKAVLSLMPLDTFVDEPMVLMQVVDDPDQVPAVQNELFALVDDIEGRPVPPERIERHAFYERARQAYAIVATGEQRAYGNVLFTKGVIF